MTIDSVTGMKIGYESRGQKQILELENERIGKRMELELQKFVESYRCRKCKVKLNLDNFGDLGENHGIFCIDCI